MIHIVLRHNLCPGNWCITVIAQDGCIIIHDGTQEVSLPGL